MERRIEFAAPDLTYLANLCHNCGACYHHCQYTPPHPFAVNVPKVFAEVRAQTYQDDVWPRAFAPLLQRNGLAAGLIVAGSRAAFVLAMVILVPGATWLGAHTGSGAFYTVVPRAVMVATFAPFPSGCRRR